MFTFIVHLAVSISSLVRCLVRCCSASCAFLFNWNCLSTPLRVFFTQQFWVKLKVALPQYFQVDLLMQPVKLKKTPAQRKHTRSVNSPWARGGAKKIARTEQWRKSQYPIQVVLLEHFLKEHNLTLESMHAYLVEHFDSEAHIESQEDDWPEWEMASAVVPPSNSVPGLAESEWEEVELEDVEYDTTKGNALSHRIPPSTASSSLDTRQSCAQRRGAGGRRSSYRRSSLHPALSTTAHSAGGTCRQAGCAPME